jgi:hypothetical protein
MGERGGGAGRVVSSFEREGKTFGTTAGSACFRGSFVVCVAGALVCVCVCVCGWVGVRVRRGEKCSLFSSLSAPASCAVAAESSRDDDGGGTARALSAHHHRTMVRVRPPCRLTLQRPRHSTAAPAIPARRLA